MSDYLPAWATLDEAAEWLRGQTNEAWPLPRLLEHGIWPSVWLPPDCPDPPNSAVMARVFNDRHEGFLAPMCFGGDTHRLAVDRTCVLSMTRTPSGELVKFTPPLPVSIDDLRFPAGQLRELVKRLAGRGGPLRRTGIMKRSALIGAHKAEWRSIEGDLREASRNGLSAARVQGAIGTWNENKALEWARAAGKMQSAPLSPPPWPAKGRKRG